MAVRNDSNWGCSACQHWNQRGEREVSQMRASSLRSEAVPGYLLRERAAEAISRYRLSGPRFPRPVPQSDGH